MTAVRIDETFATTAAGKIGSGAAGILRVAIAAFAGWWRRQKAIRQLSMTDDFLLRDMGLSRSSIESAVRHGRR